MVRCHEAGIGRECHVRTWNLMCSIRGKSSKILIPASYSVMKRQRWDGSRFPKTCSTARPQGRRSSTGQDCSQAILFASRNQIELRRAHRPPATRTFRRENRPPGSAAEKDNPGIRRQDSSAQGDLQSPLGGMRRQPEEVDRSAFPGEQPLRPATRRK